MKTFIKTLFSLAILSISTSIFAQKEYKEAYNSGTLYLKGINELNIQAYDGNEVVFITTGEDRERSERAKGLKVLNGLGLDDNTGFGIAVTKENGNLVAQQIGKNHNSDEIIVKVPRQVNLNISHSHHTGDDIKISGVSAEIVINVNFNPIKLTNVSGPMSIKTSHGDIEAVFDKAIATGSVSLNSIHGIVDVAIPASQKAAVTLSSTYGNVYSDVDVAIEKSSDGNSWGGKTIKGTIGGGGSVKLFLKSNHNDLFLRKGK